MKKTCKECGDEVKNEQDLIEFFHEADNSHVCYHRNCYATKFNAPHARLDFKPEEK